MNPGNYLVMWDVINRIEQGMVTFATSFQIIFSLALVAEEHIKMQCFLHNTMLQLLKPMRANTSCPRTTYKHNVYKHILYKNNIQP